MLKIFNKKEEEKKYTFLDLEYGFKAINLNVVDENGKIIHNGHLLTIDRETFKVTRASDINPKLGFETNTRGELIIY